MMIGDFILGFSKHWLLVSVIGVMLVLFVLPLFSGERGK